MAAAGLILAMSLLAGAAKVDITPTDLTNLNPFGGGSFSAVHDPIFARALVLSEGAETVAIVTLDLPEVGDMTPLRQRVERELGIHFNNIMIAATHDHSAPRVGKVSPGALAQNGGPESDRYGDMVFDRVVGALKTAKAAAQPARFGLAKGDANVNVNRDQYTPGKGWGLGYDPDGPSDKTVWVLKFEALGGGKPIAVLFDYAVHSNVTFGIKEISGDLAGAAERYVERNGGEGVVALFMMGPAGDQAPRVFHAGQRGDVARDRELAYQANDAQGVVLAAEVLRVLDLITAPTSTVRIRVAARDAVCPTKAGVSQMASMTTVRSPTVTLHLSLIMLNEVGIAGVSGEVVTNIYRHLQRDTPLSNTILATIVNDRVGYLVDDAAYDKPIFEVNGSPAARGCAENAIVDGLVGMIKGLSEKAPQATFSH
jgi:Neutral/alkaline non-lysosomal ceramidase, N-terminal